MPIRNGNHPAQKGTFAKCTLVPRNTSHMLCFDRKGRGKMTKGKAPRENIGHIYKDGSKMKPISTVPGDVIRHPASLFGLFCVCTKHPKYPGMNRAISHYLSAET